MDLSLLEKIKYSVSLIGGLTNVKIFAQEKVLIDVNDLPIYVFDEPLELDLKPEDVVKYVNMMIKHAIRIKSV
jgi:hypothetical protein